jgi:hypothetical protein
MKMTTFTTPQGDLTGEIKGRDPDRHEVQVMVRRETAPAWFKERYRSSVVFLWVGEDQIHD